MLDRAISDITAYQAWKKLDPGKGFPIDQRFAALPALTKRDIREHFPQGMLPPGADLEGAVARGEVELVSTSGTTDDKVTNIWNQKWWDAAERASWKLNSHTAKITAAEHREAILVNARNVGFISDDADLPFEKRRLARYLYLNEKTDPTRWTSALMRRMVGEINAFQPGILEAAPSLLARLSRFISINRLEVFQPPLVTFTYEYTTLVDFRQIKKAFKGPFASSYGTTETGYVFMQCEAGKYHQNSDFCRVDFQRLGSGQGGPLLGRLLVTPFDNPWNHLVRFDTGDLATLEASGVCPCGRKSGIILSALNGRRASLTLTTRGRLVALSELDGHISRLEGVEEYEVVQTDQRTYELHLVCPKEEEMRLIKEAGRGLKKLYGAEAVIKVGFQPDIAPGSSGKYLVSRALFPIDFEKYLEAGA